MASQRQHRSRLATRLSMIRRVLTQVSVLAGAACALGAAVPASASVQTERQALEARVQAMRAALRDPVVLGAADEVAKEPALRTAQWGNWGNWNNWNNWKNWANQ